MAIQRGSEGGKVGVVRRLGQDGGREAQMDCTRMSISAATLATMEMLTHPNTRSCVRISEGRKRVPTNHTAACWRALTGDQSRILRRVQSIDSRVVR